MGIDGASLSGASLGLAMEAAMLRKTKEVQELEGQTAVKLIEEASKAAPPPQPSRVAPGGDVGTILDIYG